jgi:hypothetical protein
VILRLGSREGQGCSLVAIRDDDLLILSHVGRDAYVFEVNCEGASGRFGCHPRAIARRMESMPWLRGEILELPSQPVRWVRRVVRLGEALRTGTSTGQPTG